MPAKLRQTSGGKYEVTDGDKVFGTHASRDKALAQLRAINSKKSFETRFEVSKVDTSLGLVFGWAMVCTEDGEDYFDKQGDHIPQDAMLKATLDFMQNSRMAREMHEDEGRDRGTVVFGFPLTEDIAKALGIDCPRTGFLVGMRPDPEMLKRFESGELTGFSIGGYRVKDREVA